MKDNKRRLNLLIPQHDYVVFKDLVKLVRQKDDSFTESDLFRAMLYLFVDTSQKIYEKEKGETNNETTR